MIIWYFNHYAMLPGIGTPGRPYYLASALRDNGYRPVIFFASHHHLAPDPASCEIWEQIQEYYGVEYYCVPVRDYQGSRVGRFLNMRDYGSGISRLAEQVDCGRLPKPDLIISSSPHMFCYPPARHLARKYGSGLVYEVRDLWPAALVDVMGLRRWHPAILWMSAIERQAYKESDAVVSLLPGARDYMVRRGLMPERFVYIPNGVSADEWAKESEPLPPEYQQAFSRVRESGKLLVVYAGAHGIPNALDQVLDLNRINSGNRPYHFIFIGEGVNKLELQERVCRENIHFVNFLPRMKKSFVRSALRQADVCFIGWKNKQIYQYGISPNKIGDYFMAGKPVLHAVNAGNDPVAEAEAGISVDPYNAEQLDQALKKFAAMEQNVREAMGARGRKYALEHLEWGILGKKYVKLCESVVAGHKRATT